MTRIHVYRPMLADLIASWELVNFFELPDWQTRLETEARTALALLQQDESLFRDGRVRVLRAILSAIVNRLQSKQDSLYGLIDHLDQFANILPLSEELSKQCDLLLRKFDYAFWNENRIVTYQPELERRFISEQLGTGFVRTGTNMSFSHELYLHETEDILVTVVGIRHRGTPVQYAEIVFGDDVHKMMQDIQPILDKVSSTPEAREPLTPLFELHVRHGKWVNKAEAKEILRDIPRQFRP